MANLYRAHLRRTGSPQYNMTIDLVVRDDGKIADTVPVAGWWGALDSDDVWPFILNTDGEMDFGNDPKNPTDALSRYAKTDFHLKDLTIENIIFNVSYEDVDYQFTIWDLKNFADFERWNAMPVNAKLR